VRVLVAEPIAEAGVAALRDAGFDVDVRTGLSPEELLEAIPAYDGLIVRSATQVTAEVLERAERLRVVGRAGIGVDNVDVAAATKRGIVVANAPTSNVVAAAEHTIALMLALARNVPQAHASLMAHRWERSRFGGVEVYGKTLGILGFGRIGQLVAERAKGLGMRVLAFDPFVSAERFRELGVEKAESSSDVYARADFISLHLPRTPQTRGWLDAEAFAQMREGVRIVNCARGELVDTPALLDALRAGKVAGAALDVFPEEPTTDFPLFDGFPNVVVTPHLGASTAEAQDRAGVQTAEQVIAALTGGTVTTAVNIPAVPGEERALTAPFLPLCRALGRIGVGLVESSSVDRLDIAFRGRLAERDTRLLAVHVLLGVLQGHTEEPVNEVNAASVAEERGIQVSETKDPDAEAFTELVCVTVHAGERSVRVAGTGFGADHQPHLVEAWGQRFNLPLAPHPHLTFFRYRDVPGMIGRLGSTFGRHGINISSAAVGSRAPGVDAPPDSAVMVVTTDAPAPPEVVAEIARSDGFFDGRTITLPNGG
jgi:D-3-phosphoglycerate dehydrogenase